MRLISFAMTDPALRQLLPLLDGSRDHHALLAELHTRLPAENVAAFGAEQLKNALSALAQYGMLVG
jgi:hypothetical protein